MPAIILTIICLVTAVLLALTNQLTFMPRLQLEAAAAQADQQMMFPAAVRFDEFDVTARPDQFEGIEQALVARDASDQQLGFVVRSTHRGYGSDVPVLVAIQPDGTIANLKILANEETPGLGKKIEDRPFYSQFVGKKTDKAFSVNPSESGTVQVDAIAGATISSRAVAEAINQAAAAVTTIAAEVN